MSSPVLDIVQTEVALFDDFLIYRIHDGFVIDDELETLYRSVRLVVVPLRFGAGIKGKILVPTFSPVQVIIVEELLREDHAVELGQILLCVLQVVQVLVHNVQAVALQNCNVMADVTRIQN